MNDQKPVIEIIAAFFAALGAAILGIFRFRRRNMEDEDIRGALLRIEQAISVLAEDVKALRQDLHRVEIEHARIQEKLLFLEHSRSTA